MDIPEVILIGGEEGTTEICKEFGLLNAAQVERNDCGTPLIDSIFEKADAIATNQIMCYANADIIFTKDLSRSVRHILAEIQQGRFLLVGRRWNIELIEPIDFGSEWELDLKKLVKNNGTLCPPSAIDYFIFTKGLFRQIPPFTVGRPRWDNWMVYNVISRKIPVIDLTTQNLVIHQNHDYAHINQKGQKYSQRLNPEQEQNEQLLGKWWPLYMYNIWDSTHVLTEKGVEKAFILRRANCLLERIIGCISLALKISHPYSYPIYFLAKGLKRLMEFLRESLHNKRI